MSSILTNTSAMVALQTLKGINSGLEKTQSEISTGKSVATAKDNAAVWAISKVMESDVTGFRAVSDSLALGDSTVAVAQQAAETITDLLTQMKDKIVAANGENVDRNKLNNDVTALKEQIASVVGAAQFNGLNLVDGSAAGGGTNILSSLDRDSSGAVTASSIAVATQDLSTGGYVAQTVFDATTTGAAGAADSDTFGTSLATAGVATIVFDGTENTVAAPGVPDGLQVGDTISIRVGESTASVTLTADDLAGADADTNDIIAIKMKAAIEATGENVTVGYAAGSPGQITITNDGADTLAVSGGYSNVGSGGLAALATIDVSATGDPVAALGAIEGLIQTSIDAAAAFGSDAKQIEIQSNFVSKLTDSFKAGIGSLVDANMEEASARLQALQVQQQLGIQALSIANQAPQSVLSLFR